MLSKLIPAGLLAATAWANVITDVREAVARNNFALGDSVIQKYRAGQRVTPEMIEALSWLGRGALAARKLDRAESYAKETHRLALEELKKRPLDAENHLPIALGAAIEVEAQVLNQRGDRSGAVAFLGTELAAYKATSIRTRIQKNIHLLSLEGKLAPALEEREFLGAAPTPLASLRGKPVVLFFWAHWCGDCKADVPILARLMQTYGPRGLLLVAPTQLYGFTAAGDATPESETRYIEEVRKQFYAPLAGMPVPLSVANFDKYGCSTTPTLVLLDANGIVRLYHPGAMTYDALAARVKLVTTPRPSNRNSG
jgi:thiol-disulfide isomerase/thioredoxin